MVAKKCEKKTQAKKWQGKGVIGVVTWWQKNMKKDLGKKRVG